MIRTWISRPGRLTKMNESKEKVRRGEIQSKKSLDWMLFKFI